MLEKAVLEQAREHFKLIRGEVVITASLDGSARSIETLELLEIVSGLSELLTLELSGTNERKPSFSVGRRGEEPRVSFSGAPLGHEFSSLILAILHVGGHPPRFTESAFKRIANLNVPIHLETWYSSTCHNCPEVVQALNAIAALNPFVSHTAVDGAAFKDEGSARGILSVPATFAGGDLVSSGRATVEDLLDRLEARHGLEAAEVGVPEGVFDVLVIGGGPAGASAAVYAARKGLRTGLVAEKIGGQVLDTAGIENLIGQTRTEGPVLARSLEEHVRAYDVEQVLGLRASGVESTPEGLLRVLTEKGGNMTARSVVLAPGAKWRRLGVPGEEEYLTKGVTFCPHCDGPFFKGHRVAVVGGGNSGVEAAIDLSGIVEHVTLFEFGDDLRADEVLQRALRGTSNASVITGAEITEVVGDGKQVTGVAYIERATGEKHVLGVSGVFVQAGLTPSTSWLEGVVQMNSRGEIETDKRGATSLPGVFAAGDATTSPYKQIVTAMGEGATAALSAFDHIIRNPVAV